jgi:uncharacterized cofD-like protein
MPNSFRKSVVHPFKPSNRWFKWMLPGILVKRWLLTSAAGVILTALGLAIWVKLTPINRLIDLTGQILSSFTHLVPSYISGPLALILGLFLVFWGQSRTMGTIADALNPEGDRELVDLLVDNRRLNRGPKIVTIGGGTGLSNLLRGLKQYSSNITAIVTVADDGGSSGRLRREIGILPPGDIRNCLAALADEEKLLTELFQYRFQAGDGLSGHSFGNLFLTAMTEVTGDLERAIAASSKVLAIRGKVLPSTLEQVILYARLSDGRLIEGESNITKAGGKIDKIGCSPSNPPALPAAIKALEEADYIIIGPGSLYTSVIPNLLIPQIRETLLNAKVPKIYICNIMTEPGETDGYTVSDHLRALNRVCESNACDAVLVQRQPPSDEFLKNYADKNSHPVFLDREDVQNLDCRLVLSDVMEKDETGKNIRHDPYLLARTLLSWYRQTAGD